MSDADKLALAAHLHVLIRRQLGRVTDVEWMAKNRDYAMEMVRIARASPHPELHEWSAKLELAFRDDGARPELREVGMPQLAAMRRPEPVRPPSGRYVASLR